MKNPALILLAIIWIVTLDSCSYTRRVRSLLDGKQPSTSEKAISPKDTIEEKDIVDVPSRRKTLAAGPSSMPSLILNRMGYTCSYNPTTRIPNWVEWTLTADHTSGPYKRNGISFTEDYDVEDGPATSDYSRSGYDRGHMCPSGDNKWSQEAQQQSFLMTNICPQSHDLNRGDWNDLEIKCRSWAQRYKEINIVCGPIFRGNSHKKIGKNRVTVPEAFFKVILRDNAAIGFIYDNEDGHKPMREYACSIDEVEKITGIDFFGYMPDEKENTLEASFDFNDWR